MRNRREARVFLLPVALSLLVGAAWADPVLNGAYPGFNLQSLGAVNGIPSSFVYNGLTFNGSDLLISGGDTNSTQQPIYSVEVTRGSNGEIHGFNASTLTSFNVPVPFNGSLLAGGLMYIGGTLFYTIPPDGVQGDPQQAYIGQYVNGTTSSLTAVGDIPLGGLQYLPNGQLMLSATDGTWRQVTLAPGAGGLYALTVDSTPVVGLDAPADAFTSFPVGITPVVTQASVLVADSSNQELTLYGLDGNGHPIDPSPLNGNIVFGSQIVSGTITNPNSPFIAYGLAQDPSHPQSFLFTGSNNSTNAGSIWILSANSSATPIPEPAGFLLGGGGILLMLIARRRR